MLRHRQQAPRVDLVDKRQSRGTVGQGLMTSTHDPHTVARALDHLVKGFRHPSKGLHALASTLARETVPGLEGFADKHHVGNFVVQRGGERFFEEMPMFVRLGMHLVFCGHEQVQLLEGSKHVDRVLCDLSEHQGHIYDAPDSVHHIPSFVHTYRIDLSELLEPDLEKYASFNEFFFRRLKPGLRPVDGADEPAGFCSAADCRLVVYPTVDLAQSFWIKGDEFSIPALLGLPADDPLCRSLDGGALAIFRLAPADYHRFHSPADGVILGDHRDIPGQYYTGERAMPSSSSAGCRRAGLSVSVQ